MRLDPAHFGHAIGNRAPIWPFKIDPDGPLADVAGLWLPGPGRSGTKVFDLSGNGRHGTFAGASGTGVSWEATKYGAHGVHVDNGPSGGTRNIEIPSPWNQNRADYTWEIWFDYLSNPSTANVSHLISVASGGSVILAVNDETGGGDELVTTLFGFFVGGGALTSGNTYHVVVAKTASSVSFYINGLLDSTDSAGAGPGSNTGAIRIGSDNNGASNGGADIRVHRVAAWDRTLGAAEVWHLFDPATRWGLVREARLPRLWPAAGGAVTRTATGSLQAALRRQIVVQGTLDAAARAERILTALSGAALTGTALRSADLDSALRAAVLAQSNLDAALRRAALAEAGLDASVTLQGLSQRTAVLDGALRRLGALSAALDAALRVGRQGAVQLDSPLAFRDVAAAAIDAATLLGVEGPISSLQAAMRATADRATALDAILGVVVAASAGRTLGVSARGGHAIAADRRRIGIPAGKRRH